MSELSRLVAFRRRYGVEVGEAEVYARLIAEACAQDYRDPDLGHFERKARAIGPTFDPDLAVEKLHAVCNEREARGTAWRPMGTERAGRFLSVTAEERWACDIRTLGAVDETKAERAERLADERRERDRLRKRLSRSEAKRTRAERIAREVDAAVSQNASTHLKEEDFSEGGRKLRPAPWEAVGMSRATYYRRRKAGREAARRAESEMRALANSDLPSLQSDSEKLTVHGRSQPELVGQAFVGDAFGADRALRQTVRSILGRTPTTRPGEHAIAFIRRRGEIDREITETIGVHRWRALADLVVQGRLSRRALGRVLRDAGMITEESIAA